MEIDRAIKVLEQGSLAYCETEADEFCEAYDYAIATLKQKEWLIDQYEQKAESLEQDINDATSGNSPMGVNDFVRIAKLDVYRRVLKDLKAVVEE